jgi:hypothetical protein
MFNFTVSMVCQRLQQRALARRLRQEIFLELQALDDSVNEYTRLFKQLKNYNNESYREVNYNKI